MSDTIFFEPKGPFYLTELSIDAPKDLKQIKISDIKTLDKATAKDLTFLNSINPLNSSGITPSIRLISSTIRFSRFWVICLTCWINSKLIDS